MKKLISLLLSVSLALSLTATAFASVSYLPDVTAEMSNAAYWTQNAQDADRVLITREEIAQRNAASAAISDTMLKDMKNADTTFDGIARNKAIVTSAEADAKYYFGWTYGGDGKPAEWSYYQKMIDNCVDRNARKVQNVRYGVAVKRTLLLTFPTSEPIWDDPADPDFNYLPLSSIRVNEPILIYTTSADGKYYLARISCCSGWVAAEDVAICRDKEEWLGAWDIPEDEVLVVCGSKVYTDASNTHPETAKRMLTFGTKLRSVDPASVSGLVNNRSPYHNYIVELPVRESDGSYRKALALIPETAKVSEGYLPLTQENIAALALNNLGDAYGWGGMMDVEDCSGLVRLIYECFGISVARNGNWQWNMPVPKIDMTNMSTEEKCMVLDRLPLGTALCFPGHELMYLGKVEGKYYVISTASKIADPYGSGILRTRGVMINTLDIRRANGHTWMQDLTKAMLHGCTEESWQLPQLMWYHDGVAFCLANGCMSTAEDGFFKPDEALTRGEAVQALWCLAGKPADAEESAADDAEAALAWAQKQGILLGGDDGIAAEQSVTREQLAALLHRYAKAQGMETPTGPLGTYADACRISGYAAEAMSWACSEGIIRGTAEDMLLPDGTCTRAQFALMLQRFAESLPTTEQ